MNTEALNELVKQLKRHEGFRGHIYKDTQGIDTIGYGYNLEKGMPEKLAEIILLFEVNAVLTELEKLPWYKSLDDVRQSVIANMAYNMGMGGVQQFKGMINAIVNKDYKKAAAAMLDSLWAKQVTSRATELARVMESGKYS